MTKNFPLISVLFCISLFVDESFAMEACEEQTEKAISTDAYSESSSYEQSSQRDSESTTSEDVTYSTDDSILNSTNQAPQKNFEEEYLKDEMEITYLQRGFSQLYQDVQEQKSFIENLLKVNYQLSQELQAQYDLMYTFQFTFFPKSTYFITEVTKKMQHELDRTISNIKITNDDLKHYKVELEKELKNKKWHYATNGFMLGVISSASAYFLYTLLCNQ